MKYKTTAVILASGEGSRLKETTEQLGIPKHLLSIGKTNIINRLVHEFSLCCDEIICITTKQYFEQFNRNFQQFPFEVKVICKSDLGFKGDFLATANASNEHIILTMGDLIFPLGEIDNFVKNTQKYNQKNCAVICLDRGQIKKFDFRIVMTSYPKSLLKKIIPLNPESLLSVGSAFIKNYFQGYVTLDLANTLFNINTNESYNEAKTFFKN
ncbi:MAG: NTP transferase domain-containing protein [Oligoflexia bacterium]|nr:NTP transferase domain-containing protein [Oligoflexia bacterium]